MSHLPVSLTEKVLRALIVYLALIGFLGPFCKQELAQLNPFGLIVLLCLSNPVQNAIITNESVSGGVVGAISLLAVNWWLGDVLCGQPRLDWAREGAATVLLCDGNAHRAVVRHEKLTAGGQSLRAARVQEP